GPADDRRAEGGGAVQPRHRRALGDQRADRPAGDRGPAPPRGACRARAGRGALRMSLSTSGRTWDEATSPPAVALARRFEAAWRQAPDPARRPDLGAFLAQAGDRPGARLALLRAEMALRWEAGERPDAASYRDRFPGLGDETFVALVYEE